MAITSEQLAAQITALQKDIRAVRSMLSAVLQQMPAPGGDRVIVDRQRGQFHPGTGWVDGEPRPDDRPSPAPPTSSEDYRLSDEDITAGLAGLAATRAARRRAEQ
jgi:hypothetical protein